MISASTRTAVNADPGWRKLYRVGGVSGMAIVVPYLIAIGLVSIVPLPVDADGGQTLEYIASHRWLYLVEQVLWLAPGILAMILLLGLVVAVKDVDKSYAAIAGMVGVASWALTLALPITGGGAPVLITLSDRYAAATSAEQRRALATVAEGLIAENDTPSLVGVLTAVGILLVSSVMLKGVFPMWIAILGVGTGAIGIAAETLRPVLGIGYAGYGILLLVWFVAAGVGLYRLGSEHQHEPLPTSGRRTGW